MTQERSNKKLIPIDVSEEILWKLPGKSLLRFKCVCQQWHDRISDDVFIRAYSQRNIGDKNFVAIDYNATVKVLHMNASCDKLIIKDSLELPHCYFNHYFRFSCSCDGILCFNGLTTGSDNGILLYNPNIRKHRILKASQDHLVRDTYGIGYDSSIDDYKLVRITLQGLRNRNAIKAEVMALKTNLWRQISCDVDCSPDLLRTEPAFSLNGTVYWLQREPTPKRLILRFCLADETFSELSLPNEPRAGESLIELRGKLCLASGLAEEIVRKGGLNIWIVKDESWVKLYTGFFPSKFVYDCRFIYIEGGALVRTINRGTVYIHGMKEKTDINSEQINICSRIESVIMCANTLILP